MIREPGDRPQSSINPNTVGGTVGGLMRSIFVRRVALAGASLLAFQSQSLAQSQQAAVLPELVVTSPNRIAQTPEKAGSAITIIRGDDLAKGGPSALKEALQAVPGLSIYESGGVGGLSNVSLRGASPGQSLVLIDGIRVGDPSAIAGEVNFGSLALGDVERIEVLRGPQSALYGSDAMGGVINIVTRKGAREMRRTVSIEAGRYGTLSTRASVSGATDSLSYAFSVNQIHSDGFSRYGYRINRITSTLPKPLEADSTDKVGASGKVVYDPGNGVSLEVGATLQTNLYQFDNPGAWVPANRDNPFERGHDRVSQIYARAKVDMLDGKLSNKVTVFANETNRVSRLVQSCFDAVFNSYDCNLYYKGRRYGAEYQGDLRLGVLGMLIFGARLEEEKAQTAEKWFSGFTDKQPRIDASQTTRSIFALHQMTLGERLHVSLGGRVDSIINGPTFATWRATAAYDLSEYGTKLRASIGTGAKAASLYQRFSEYGTPGLQAEKSLGMDVGIDQTLFANRLKLSAGLFDNRFSNLIDYTFVPCNAAQPFGCYLNIGKARTSGAELSAEAVLVPEVWRARASYTYLVAEDLNTRVELARRPRHKGVFSLIYSGIDKLEVEARVSIIGNRLNDAFSYTRLPAYGKLDMRAEYKVNDVFSVFARAENLTNARYEEVLNYGIAGRSFFGGVKATW